METLHHSKHDLFLLTQSHANPCVSLYAPLARGGNQKEDELKLKQLIRQAETQLTSQGISFAKAADLVQPMENVLRHELRDLQGEKFVGLAFFASPDLQKAYMASHATPQVLAIDDHFDLRPLVDLIPLEDEFYVLAINKDQIILFHGSQSSLTPIFLPPGASSELTRRAAPGGVTPKPETNETEALAAGNLVGKLQSTVSLERDYDTTEEYIRSVCQDLDTFFSSKKIPLIIASTEALFPVVEKYLKYPHLVKEGIHTRTAPDRSTAAELFAQAQKILERYHTGKKQEELARYREIEGTKFTATSVADIMQAASMGRIEVLLASPQRNLFGHFDRNTGKVETHAERQSTDTELISLAVQEAINHDARVCLVDEQELPKDSLMAAVLRW
jgi:hypothetical protein